MDRREFLLLLLLAAQGLSLPAVAKDGDSDNSGSGSSNSGGDDDDDDDDDKDDDDDDDDDDDGSSGGSGSGRSRSGSDQDDARRLLKTGKVMPLQKAMSILSKEVDGRVIDARLVRKSKRYFYEFKVVSDSGKVRKVSMDALTGRIPGILGL